MPANLAQDAGGNDRVVGYPCNSEYGSQVKVNPERREGRAWPRKAPGRRARRYEKEACLCRGKGLSSLKMSCLRSLTPLGSHSENSVCEGGGLRSLERTPAKSCTNLTETGATSSK